MGKIVENLKLTKWVFEKNLSWILGGTRYSECARDGWYVFSFHWRWTCIFTCSILFPNELDIQLESWHRTRVKWDKKEWNFFSPILKVVCCVCSANGHVYSERLRPFRPNECVCSGTTRFAGMDVSTWRTDMFVWKGCTHSNRTDVYFWKGYTRYNQKISSDFYIKGNTSPKREPIITQNSFSLFYFLYTRFVQIKILFRIFVVFWSVSISGQVEGTC